jgi:hypothetical protein
MLETQEGVMTQSKLPTAKTRKPREGAKTRQQGKSAKADKTRKPGDVELTEESLSKITGGGGGLHQTIGGRT